MTEPVRLARQTRVADCQDLLGIGPLLVHREDDLLDVVRRSAVQPETRTIGVIDDEGRVIGIIRVLRLTESIVARVAPEAVMAGIRDADEVGRFGHAVEDRIAGDIMEPPATISPDATVSEAFREMHRNRVTGMYVVNAEGRPTGYIDLLELAIRLADALEEERAESDEGSPSEPPAPSDPRAEGR
ncbi:MAG: CBS domain-containing protein [Chloroflexi bacterium]|nr:CBS domain-containing protein [Chloroflexota bacterium]